MASQFLLTIGNASQLETAFHGKFLKGQAEGRIAMVGRSNVGKSTLINGLLGRALARTSDQPGKTRALHFYLWEEAKLILADLPGYGYAKVSKDERERWGRFIEAYLRADEGLQTVLILLDARHGPLPLDEEAIRYIVSIGVPVQIVFTKADSLKNQSERAKRRKEAGVALEKLGLNPEEAHWLSGQDRDLGFSKLEKGLRRMGKD